ncbi:MAG: alpha amylase C-terminal domain-containing protein [Bacteroidota bacterium]
MEELEEPKLVKNDPWLSPYAEEIAARIQRQKDREQEIAKKYGSLSAFADGHHYFGLNYDEKKKGWWYREWAPAAKGVALVGDFNNWDRSANPAKSLNNGVWELFLEDATYKDRLVYHSKFKVHVATDSGGMDRLPAYVRYVVQDPETHDFAGCLHEHKVFQWTDQSFTPEEANKEPYIYECHIGMAQEEPKVGSYLEFAEKVLPKIVEQGYNAIQMMAVQEHPYYGSFGYHVSNFFAPSSRFGTPEDLKYLINKAHESGVAVIMDIVHSHAVKNLAEGLNEFDGSDDQYFHPGGKGIHNQWDSKLFNYGKEEVLRFLLSNVKYWIDEFHFDGFRYDGVTSMLYFHHGDHVSFDHYDKYFNEVDWDVLVYLQLANQLIRKIKPYAITIAEDMSGMPGLGRPVAEGGLGFDFRLAMGIPDYWIKVLKHKSDDEWNVHEIWDVLSNRRHGERTIAYSESHDQALVGDKSIAFWLMDKEMYTNMHINHDSLIIDRGIALHKMIRLLTMSLGGEGWLNFIGNEFGHPEWVDFPREGNDWSYHYARRQWSLAENEELRYKFLYRFGGAMVRMARANHLVSALPASQINMDQDNHTLIYERNNLVFAMNFSPDNAVPDYRFKVPNKGNYQIILNTDHPDYGGFGRVDDGMTYPCVSIFGEHFLSVYLPNRVGLVLKRVDD